MFDRIEAGYDGRVMGHSSADFLALAPIWYVVFLFSTVCHEAAHALVATWGGDRTAYVGGQVSLDPIPHVKREPFGLIVIPILTLVTTGGMFGWGSAPFDPHWQIRFPRRAALMALAGPLANFTLAIAAAIAMHIGLYSGIFQLPGGEGGITHLVACHDNVFLDGVATFLSILFSLNVLLGAFNLLPVPPLDGYTVLGLVLPERTTLQMIELSRSPGFSFIGIIFAWKIFPFIFGPVMGVAYTLLYLPLR